MLVLKFIAEKKILFSKFYIVEKCATVCSEKAL